MAAQFIKQAREILKDERPANMITLRGFARRPPIPSMQDIYGVTPAAVAIYPMYRGLARLVGMTPLPAGANLNDQVEAMRKHWDTYDFFFFHHKYTDSAGEDGNFDGKVQRIEELDACIPDIAALEPQVLIVTADHSTPAALRDHSWHPVPLVIAADSCRTDAVQRFSETECLRGGLGRFAAKYLIPVALAHARRLQKFGA